MQLNLPYNEKEVLARTADGDEQAFALLFKEWEPLLSTHIYRITESKPLTEEIVQDVFLKIWQTREVLAEIRNFKAYLMTVSRNHAINELNRMVREWQKMEKYAKTMADDQRSADEDQHKIIQYALIDEAIEKLPPRQKEVYLLSRHERMSYAEIAARLNIGKDSVKKNLQLASQAIAAHIRHKLPLLITLLELLK